MIRLTGEAPQPRVFTFDAGVSLTLVPAGLAARQRSRRMASEAYQASGQDGDIGGVAFSTSLIAHAVTAWTGIGDAKGKAVKPTVALVEELLQRRPDIFDRLDREYVAPALALATEKNASSASPRGRSAKAAKPTAPPATGSAPNAPSGSGRRKPKTARPSGK